MITSSTTKPQTISEVHMHVFDNAYFKYTAGGRKIASRRHVFGHVTTLRARSDVCDVAL